jgi:hypothetical protein
MHVLISDGVKNHIGYVDSIQSDTQFTVLSIEAGGFGFQSATVDITIDFSSSWDKGTNTFSKVIPGILHSTRTKPT